MRFFRRGRGAGGERHAQSPENSQGRFAFPSIHRDSPFAEKPLFIACSDTMNPFLRQDFAFHWSMASKISWIEKSPRVREAYPKSWTTGGGLFFMKYAFKLKLECAKRYRQAIAECFGCPSFRIQDFFEGEKRFLHCQNALSS